jgi:hypothetical protein
MNNKAHFDVVNVFYSQCSYYVLTMFSVLSVDSEKFTEHVQEYK